MSPKRCALVLLAIALPVSTFGQHPQAATSQSSLSHVDFDDIPSARAADSSQTTEAFGLASLPGADDTASEPRDSASAHGVFLLSSGLGALHIVHKLLSSRFVGPDRVACDLRRERGEPAAVGQLDRPTSRLLAARTRSIRHPGPGDAARLRRAGESGSGAEGGPYQPVDCFVSTCPRPATGAAR